MNGKQVYEGIADLLKKFGGVSEVHECRIPEEQYRALLETTIDAPRYIDKLRREFPGVAFIQDTPTYDKKSGMFSGRDQEPQTRGGKP